MSEIESISESEFLELATEKEWTADISFEEKEWYSTKDKTKIGVVVKDRTDKDWGYVVLEPDEQGIYRATDTGHSLSDPISARYKLLEALEARD